MLYKCLLFIQVFLFCIKDCSFAQKADSMIKEIETKYHLIRDNRNKYDTTSIELLEKSTEGVATTGYFDGQNIKLITIIYFGETGKSELEYYFSMGDLFFAFEKQYKYNRPIYWDKKQMEDNDDTETFDPKKTIVSKDKYYFHKEKLFLWLDNQNKEVNLTFGTNKLVGQGLIANAHKIRESFKK